jgi:hypothetical protein
LPASSNGLRFQAFAGFVERLTIPSKEDGKIDGIDPLLESRSGRAGGRKRWRQRQGQKSNIAPPF